ncbi:hypothetical protein [Pseudaminobacter sp. NGMCC 1.201702]|uniref:hypothetical protein n=1 Tax=Pseudaminobacter sp. NGMCC 1.201702 TaxID=3391825 RepID=UPI0039EEC25A
MARNSYYRSEHWLKLRAAAIGRDGGICTVPGCNAKGTHVDHIKTRPNSDSPTSFDVLPNLRTLCSSHDAQVKELPSGKRRRAGKLVVKGVDKHGWPLDPNHPWAR